MIKNQFFMSRYTFNKILNIKIEKHNTYKKITQT